MSSSGRNSLSCLACGAQDGMEGLVTHALTALVRRNIQRLTDTYTTIVLTEIAQAARTGTDAKDAERHVLDMIVEGQMFATISQRDGMVAFIENPEEYDTSQQ